jgi:hypothetical protein
MRIAMATTPPTLAPGALAEREGVLRALRRHAAALRGLGVSHIFGFSAPWPGAMPGADSDVDVLIAIPSGRRFSPFDLGEVRVELCELLDRRSMS